MRKRIVLTVHSLSGLVLGLFLLLMSLSGAVLVFHEDLNKLQYPATESNSTEPALNFAFETVKERYPNAMISNCIPANPIIYSLYDTSYRSGKAPVQVFLNATGKTILKTRGAAAEISSNFPGWLAKFHNSMHLGKTGEWLLGFFALVFMLSIITGLILYRSSLSAVLLFRKTAYKKANWHQLIGVYALLFNLMIAVSGFWMQRYVFKKDFYRANDFSSEIKPTPYLSYNIDSGMHELQKVHPDFTAGLIYFPQRTAGKTAIYGSRAGNGYVHSKKMADVILLDSLGQIAGTRFVTEIDPADRYDIINSQLHMGRFGGIGIKIIYFVFGLSGAFLSITGFGLWVRRRRSEKKLPGRQ